MSTHYHVCISIAAVQKHLSRGTHDKLFLMIDDKPATAQQLSEAVVEALAKGYTVLPPCDNVTATGHCAGHPDTEEL